MTARQRRFFRSYKAADKGPDARNAGLKAGARIVALAVALGCGGSPSVVLLRADDATVLLPEILVASERVGRQDVVVPRGELRPPEPNFGAELLAIPGVSAHARAADAMEPSIRGLGFDRVTTTLNGLPLLNASPERTNSPVVILGSSAVRAITVTKGLPSVTQGPVSSGGAIALSTDPGPLARARPGATVQVDSMYQGGRDGTTTRGEVAWRAGAWDGTVTAFRNRLGDYDAADGRTVAADLDDYGASAGLGWHDGAHRWRAEYLHRRLRRQETVSLPLDGKNTDADVITITDRWAPENGLVKGFEARVGYAGTDPFITSEDRKAPVLTTAQANARSFGAGAKLTWTMPGATSLATGVDFARQQRRAVRTVNTAKDYIWPNVEYEDAGVFAEWTRGTEQGWEIRCGGRVDLVGSEARDADQAALGLPIRTQFAAYNGPDAARTERHTTAGAANGTLTWRPNGKDHLYLGLGYSRHAPQIMERYRAFLNALGGDGHGGNAVELGNPALRDEVKLAVEAGGRWHGPHADLETTVYTYQIDDFILRVPIGKTQAPLPNMVVFGYRNVDAVLYGGEVALTFRPAAQWELPMTVAVAQGRNTTAHTGLAELPPWEGTLSLRHRGTVQGRAAAMELGGRWVGERSNPAPLDNPLFSHSGGFLVLHLRTGIALSPHLRLEGGIENLLDRSFTEYLSPPVAPVRPASGDLAPGTHVPAPGRSLWCAVTLRW